MLSNSIFLPDAAATENFGIRLAHATASTLDVKGIPAHLKTLGGRIHLRGELGAGKTTLTRGIMRGYGYTGAVKSPTYTLVEPYELESSNIYHFDLYRLKDPQEAEFLGIAEYFEPENLCIIEWPEHGNLVIPGPDLDIVLETQGQGRRLTWSARSKHGETLAERLSR